MEQYFEFIGNNLILVGIWIALALALIFHRSKTGAQAVGPQQAVMLINRKDGVVLDVRDKKDYDTGHIVDSVHIPYNKLSTQLAELDKLKSRPIIVVCKMGQHSGDACKILRSAGFEQVVRLRGGMSEWRAQNLPLVQKADKAKAVKAKAVKNKSGKGKAGKTRAGVSGAGGNDTVTPQVKEPAQLDEPAQSKEPAQVKEPARLEEPAQLEPRETATPDSQEDVRQGNKQE